MMGFLAWINYSTTSEKPISFSKRTSSGFLSSNSGTPPYLISSYLTSSFTSVGYEVDSGFYFTSSAATVDAKGAACLFPPRLLYCGGLFLFFHFLTENISVFFLNSVNIFYPMYFALTFFARSLLSA